MKPEKKLESLFERARSEQPKVSFEEVAERFNASVSTSTSMMIKEWVLRNITLNSIIVMIIGSMLFISGILILSPKKSKSPTSEATIQEDNSLNKSQKPLSYHSPDSADVVEQAELTKKIPLKKQRHKDSAYHLSQRKSTVIEKLNKVNSIDQIPEIPTVVISDSSIKTVQVPISNAKIEVEEFENLKFISTDSLGKNQNVPETIVKKRKETRLVIKKDDTQEQVKHFMAALESTGLSLRKSSHNFKEGYLNHIFLWFRHQQGLNFKLKGTGFEQLEIKIFYDQKRNIQSFVYRFNREKFSKEVPLNCRGYKTYFYGDGFSGVSGKTNINISNEQ